MEEYGVVIQDKKGSVLVKAERSTACDSCSSKKTCHSGTGTEALIEADNPVGAKVGDHVVFTVAAGDILKAGVLLYLGPALSFIAGVVIGQVLSEKVLTQFNPDLVSGVLGVIFLGIAFFGLKLYGRLAQRSSSFKPKILRVV
jgi:sigma-E factor negative regulatory protein RseC